MDPSLVHVKPRLTKEPGVQSMFDKSRVVIHDVHHPIVGRTHLDFVPCPPVRRLLHDDAEHAVGVLRHGQRFLWDALRPASVLQPRVLNVGIALAVEALGAHDA